MRSKLNFCLSILFPFALTVFYVWSTAADVAFRDDMYLIKGGFVENFCTGNLSFIDLWRSAGAVRFLGYNILQIVNIKWLGMNSKIIVLLIPFLMLASALLIYSEFRKSLISRRSEKFINISFLLLSLLIFHVIQWESLTFSYGFIFQSSTPFFIACVMCMELFIVKGETRYGYAVLIMSALAILVFGGSHSFAFAPALGVTFMCHVWINRTNLSGKFWVRVFIITTFLAFLAFLYMYRLQDYDYFPKSSHDMSQVLTHPFNASQFLLAALGASVVGVNVADMYLSFHIMVVLGMFVLFLYGLSLYLFVASHLHKFTYLPFYLIMQSFFYLVFVTIGRFGLGIDYGMASRYTCISVYGLVGSLWVIIFFLVNSNNIKPFKRTLLYGPAVIIFSGILVTSIVEWRIQPHRQAYFKTLHEIALRVDIATDEELSKFEERPVLVRESLKVLRDCRLNVYRQSSGNL